MSSHALFKVGGIPVEVVRKEIKNLHVGVYPPNGHVRVAAPMRLDDEAIRVAIVSRLGWIRRQQSGFMQQVRQSERELVTGESHYFRGRRYLLEVVFRNAAPTVTLSNNRTMRLQVRPDSEKETRNAVLQRWYRATLKEQIPELVSKWEPRVGVRIRDVRIRRMKTLWGSCSRNAARIWLNTELAKKPYGCLEFVFVHELVHLHERLHNERFLAWMDRLMPNWRYHRDALNAAPLAHEDWSY